MSDSPRLCRIVLLVTDIERGTAFYQALLATRGTRLPGARHDFACGGAHVVVAGPVRGCARPLPTPDVTTFAVRDLAAVHARASALGCLSAELIDGASAAEMCIRAGGERAFFADDPWGNRLCFVAEDTLVTGGP